MAKVDAAVELLEYDQFCALLGAGFDGGEAFGDVSVFLGIIGGWAAGVLGHFYSTAEYVRGVQDYMKNWDLVVMLIKALLFSFAIASVSCFKGYTVKGGALEIGKASTQAVVLSSIVVIIINFFVAFLLLD